MLRRVAAEWVGRFGLPRFRSDAASLRRGYSAAGTIQDHQEEIEKINDLFVEARDEIEYAKEDADSTYFNESYEDAQELVEGVLGRFRDVLGKLSEEEQGRLQRSMGMKMEQLKAELQELDTLHE